MRWGVEHRDRNLVHGGVAWRIVADRNASDSVSGSCRIDVTMGREYRIKPWDEGTEGDVLAFENEGVRLAKRPSHVHLTALLLDGERLFWA